MPHHAKISWLTLIDCRTSCHSEYMCTSMTTFPAFCLEQVYVGVLKVVSILKLPTEVSWTLYSSPPATVGSFLISIGHLHSTSPVCVYRLVMSLLPPFQLLFIYINMCCHFFALVVFLRIAWLPSWGLVPLVTVMLYKFWSLLEQK